MFNHIHRETGENKQFKDAYGTGWGKSEWVNVDKKQSKQSYQKDQSILNSRRTDKGLAAMAHFFGTIVLCVTASLAALKFLA